MPKNFRAPRAREDNKGGPTKKKFGLKKFGVRLTDARRMFFRWRALSKSVHTLWYKKEKGRDEAYNHFKKQRQWLDPVKLEYKKVEKVSR